MMRVAAFSLLLVGCFLYVQAQPATLLGHNLRTDRRIDPRCEGRTGLFPIPGDCTHYLVCRPNRSRVRKCPEGLEFHPIFYCTFPDRSYCTEGLNAPQMASDAFPCPRAYGIFPYPEDCRKYVVCQEGMGTVKTCPEDQVFIEDLGCYESKDCPTRFRSQDEDETEAPSNDILHIMNV